MARAGSRAVSDGILPVPGPALEALSTMSREEVLAVTDSFRQNSGLPPVVRLSPAQPNPVAVASVARSPAPNPIALASPVVPSSGYFRSAKSAREAQSISLCIKNELENRCGKGSRVSQACFVEAHSPAANTGISAIQQKCLPRV